MFGLLTFAHCWSVLHLLLLLPTSLNKSNFYHFIFLKPSFDQIFRRDKYFDFLA